MRDNYYTLGCDSCSAWFDRGGAVNIPEICPECGGSVCITPEYQAECFAANARDDELEEWRRDANN